MLPEAIVLEAIDTEFPSMYCFLVALLVFVDEVKVGLNCKVCPLVAFQFSTYREFPQVIYCTINLVH